VEKLIPPQMPILLNKPKVGLRPLGITGESAVRFQIVYQINISRICSILQFHVPDLQLVLLLLDIMD